tara:strand:+ start:870 stop:1325 length:456 start_codon:yes stop_codon:yes gene_type:complete
LSEQVLDSCHPQDVGDLVWIGNEHKHASRHDGACKFSEREIRTLDVHVRVDQPGTDMATIQIDDLGHVVDQVVPFSRQGSDPATCDNDIRRECLPGIDTYDSTTTKNPFSGFLPKGDADQMGTVNHGCMGGIRTLWAAPDPQMNKGTIFAE